MRKNRTSSLRILIRYHRNFGIVPLLVVAFPVTNDVHVVDTSHHPTIYPSDDPTEALHSIQVTPAALQDLLSSARASTFDAGHEKDVVKNPI